MQLFKYYNLFSAYKFLKKYAVNDKILRQKDGMALLSFCPLKTESAVFTKDAVARI